MSIFRKELCKKESGSSPLLSFYCTTLQSSFAVVVLSIETAIILPTTLINLQKAILKKIQSFLYKKVMKEVEALETLILSVLKILDMKTLKLGSISGSDFCETLFACEALIETLSSTLGVDLTNFNTFKKYVCKTDLLSTVSAFITEKLNSYVSQLNELYNELLAPINRVEQEINRILNSYYPFPTQPYEENVNMTVYQWLNLIDKFSDCAFSICDFAYDASEKKEEWMKKLLIDTSALDKVFEKSLEKNAVVQDKIDELLEIIATKQMADSCKVPSDEIMKS